MEQTPLAMNYFSEEKPKNKANPLPEQFNKLLNTSMLTCNADTPANQKLALWPDEGSNQAVCSFLPRINDSRYFDNNETF